MTPDRWVSDYRAVTTVLSPDAPAFTLASFEVRDGQPGAVPLSPAPAASAAGAREAPDAAVRGEMDRYLRR